MSFTQICFVSCIFTMKTNYTTYTFKCSLGSAVQDSSVFLLDVYGAWVSFTVGSISTISGMQSWPWPLCISVGSQSYIITGGRRTLVMVWLVRSWFCFGDNLVQFSFNLEHVFTFSFSSGLRLIRMNNVISLYWTKRITDHVTDPMINGLADWILTAPCYIVF